MRPTLLWCKGGDPRTLHAQQVQRQRQQRQSAVLVAGAPAPRAPLRQSHQSPVHVQRHQTKNSAQSSS